VSLLRSPAWVKAVAVPCIAAAVSAGVQGWYDARQKAGRDEALLTAFEASTRGLDDAHVVLLACQEQLMDCGARARAMVKRSERAAKGTEARAPMPAPTPPPSSSVLKLQAVERQGASAVLDQIARDHGWRR